MGIDALGNGYGTIGGCSEAAIMVRARKIMGTGTSCVVKIDMTNEVAESEGMVCGGTMRVLHLKFLCRGKNAPCKDNIKHYNRNHNYGMMRVVIVVLFYMSLLSIISPQFPHILLVMITIRRAFDGEQRN